MARQSTIVFVVLFGLMALASSSPLFEVGESFADDEEAEFEEEMARAFEEEGVRAYDEAEDDLMSQLQETRRSQEVPPRLLKSSNFCYGKRDGNYADVSNPRAFYMCDKAGQTWTMNCQAGLVYDQLLNRCEWNRNGGQQTGDYGRYPQPPPPPPPPQQQQYPNPAPQYPAMPPPQQQQYPSVGNGYGRK